MALHFLAATANGDVKIALMSGNTLETESGGNEIIKE